MNYSNSKQSSNVYRSVTQSCDVVKTTELYISGESTPIFLQTVEAKNMADF